MSLELVPLLLRARGTTRESLIEGAKQKYTQREGLHDLSIRSGGGGGQLSCTPILCKMLAKTLIFTL